jgi:hypothetical protein
MAAQSRPHRPSWCDGRTWSGNKEGVELVVGEDEPDVDVAPGLADGCCADEVRQVAERVVDLPAERFEVEGGGHADADHGAGVHAVLRSS